MKGIILLLLVAYVSLASCAYELGFYLTFFGAASSNTTGVAKAKANSQQTTTLVDNVYGITYRERQYIGATAIFLSNFDLSVPSETGNISFGLPSPNSPSHVITLSLLSFKAVENWHGFQHAAGAYNVTGGLGAFKGADGVLAFTRTSNYTSNEFLTHVTGSLWIQGNPPPPPQN
jgi:hypothetical protein